MTKTEIKHKAQDELLHGMQTAFARMADDISLSGEELDLLRIEADKQMSRVEKMFGYEPGSFYRGV